MSSINFEDLKKSVSKNSINIYGSNIRSYNSNFLLFKTYLETNDLLNFFDIIFFNECWLSDKTKIETLDNYTIEPISSYTNKTSGIIAYINSNIDYRLFNLSVFNVCDIIHLNITLTNAPKINIYSFSKYNTCELNAFYTHLKTLLLH